MNLWHLSGGIIALALGLIGIYDEYFMVVEFLKGSIQPLLAVVGLFSILAGTFATQTKIGHVVFGLAMIGLGTYGFFDEYYAVLDFFKGFLPLLMLLIGIVAVVVGVKKLD